MYLERYAHAFNLPVSDKNNNWRKAAVKLLTCWIFPKILRKQAKRHLKYYFNLSPKPETFWEKHIYLKTQQNFIAAHKNNDIFSYRIVSLGCDCFARTIPTLWGIKPRKKQGEKGYPFDLSDNPLSSVVKYIENDFKGYFASLQYNSQLHSWFLAADEIVYCHEDDCNQDSRQTIIKRFSQRIDNFRDVLNKDTKPAIFISHYNPCLCPNNSEEIQNLYNRLYQKLSELRGDRPFRFFIIDTSGKLSNLVFMDGIRLLSFPWLPQPYIWHQPECRYKKTGLKFEQIFINELLSAVRELTA